MLGACLPMGDVVHGVHQPDGLGVGHAGTLHCAVRCRVRGEMPGIHRVGSELLVLATVQRQTVKSGRRLLATCGACEGGKVHGLHLAVLKGEPATVGQVLAGIQLLLGRGGQIRSYMRLEAAIALGIQRELAAIRAEQMQGIHIFGEQRLELA